MGAKGRFIRGAAMSSMTVSMVALPPARPDLGLRAAAFPVLPSARRTTGRILAKREGNA